MDAIMFKGYNTIYAKNQEEYLNLPAHISKDSSGTVSTCWKMTFSERIKALLFGKIYLQIITHQNPLQPLLPSISKPALLYSLEKEEKKIEEERKNKNKEDKIK